jgi:hypothetical protein
MGVLIPKKARKRVISIFEHPNDVYSIYLKDNADVIWVDGKIELYKFLKSLSESRSNL